MSKGAKRGKSGGGGGGNSQPPSGNVKWETALQTAPFEEETWKPSVVLLVPKSVDDQNYLSILQNSIQSGIRKLFSLVTPDNLNNLVQELGNPKVKKGKDVPRNYEVCEACKPVLDAGEPLPLALLVRLIKFQLLVIKAADQARREAEIKADLDKEKAKLAEKTGADRSKSPKKTGKKNPEPTGAKEGSKLKKRGEEDKTKKFLEDEPEDGAHHYIVLSGFYQPHLLPQLEEVGIPVDAIIRFNCEDYRRFQPTSNSDISDQKDERTKALEEIAREERLQASKELQTFWKDVSLILQQQPDASRLQDTARLEYEVKSLIVPANLEENDSKAMQSNQQQIQAKISFGATMFDDLSSLIYDLFDAKRLYATFLENLKLVHIPVQAELSTSGQYTDSFIQSVSPAPVAAVQVVVPAAGEAGVAPDGMFSSVDMRYYNDLINTIPNESVSVSLVLHCMLQQIVATVENHDPPSEVITLVATDGLHSDLQDHLNNLASNLALSREEQEVLSGAFDLHVPAKTFAKEPLLLNPHDDIAIRTHHLQTIYGFNAEEVERNMLYFLPLAFLTEVSPVSPATACEHAARLQELLYYCFKEDSLHPAEIDLALRQFVLECMDLTSTDPNGFIVTRESEGLLHTAIPWDDPYPYFRGMIPRPEKHENFLMRKFQPHHKQDEEVSQSLPHPLIRPPPHRVSSTFDIPSLMIDIRPEVSYYLTHVVDSVRYENYLKKAFKNRENKAKKIAQVRWLLDHPGGIVAETQSLPSDHSSSHSASRVASPSMSNIGSKKGILRSASAAQVSEPRTRSNSVYFDRVLVGQEKEIIQISPLTDSMDEKKSSLSFSGMRSPEDSYMEVVDSQKRILDQWCFTEHFEPHVLLQVLREASYTLPYVNIHEHKRDNTVLLVLHNPHTLDLQLHVDWHCELHSNLGFRNYLENVAESISDWLKEKEAEYQAKLLSQEVQKIREEEEAATRALAKATQKDRAKTPKKSPSRTKSPKGKGSRSSSLEGAPLPQNDSYIRPGSLKALKVEQDRIKAEEEEKLTTRRGSKSRSPRKEEAKEGNKGVPSGTHIDSKGRLSKDLENQASKSGSDLQQVVQEKYWPFSGYDLGNNLVHCSGITTTLFPSDGGQIRTERTDFVQGTTSIKTSILKDGHVFTVHILDPVEDKGLEEVQPVADNSTNQDTSDSGEKPGSEAEEARKCPRKSVSYFGSITAHLADGMTLSFSQFGASGEAPDLKRPEPEPVPVPVIPLTPLSPSGPPVPTKESPKPKGKEKGRDKVSPQTDLQSTPTEPMAVPAEEERLPEQTFQQLYVTSPNGLSVSFFLESSVGVKPAVYEDRRLIVKQCFPHKTNGHQPCENFHKQYTKSEVSRIITSEGTVIKNMVDETVEVLYADSTVSIHTGPFLSPSTQMDMTARSQPVETDVENTEKAKKGGRSSGRGQRGHVVEKVSDPVAFIEKPSQKGTWTTTYPNGEKVIVTGDKVEEGRPVLISVASDPETKQSMASRDDRVVTVCYPDGTTIVEHSDGTRITTYYRQTQVPVPQEDSAETGESPQYELKTIKFVKVECPAYATVEFNCVTSENLTIFGNGTTFNVFPDGYYMVHQIDGSKIELDTEGTMVYFPKLGYQMEQLLAHRELQYVMRHNADVVVEVVDPDGNVFNVRSNGDFTVIPANLDDGNSLESIEDPENSGNRKLETYQQHAPRFFIIHSDSSGTELLRWQDVAEFLMAAEQSSATATLKEPLNDFPGAVGITILQPYLRGLPDQWRKKYDMDSIIPHGIRSRDLTTLPAKEYKKPGPPFGSNIGRGLSIGTTVSLMNLRIPVIRCPDCLEIRQLVQHKPVNGVLREKLRLGLRHYAETVIRRIQEAEDLQADDPRSEEQKNLAADLQNLALSQNKETWSFLPVNLKDVYEAALMPSVPSPPPAPQAKRTQADWERDRRELEEGLVNRAALRYHQIPPYFESELGKAFLLTQAKDVDEMMRQLSDISRPEGSVAVPSYPDSPEPLVKRQAKSSFSLGNLQTMTTVEQQSTGHLGGKSKRRYTTDTGKDKIREIMAQERQLSLEMEREASMVKETEPTKQDNNNQYPVPSSFPTIWDSLMDGKDSNISRSIASVQPTLHSSRPQESSPEGKTYTEITSVPPPRVEDDVQKGSGWVNDAWKAAPGFDIHNLRSWEWRHLHSLYGLPKLGTGPVHDLSGFALPINFPVKNRPLEPIRKRADEPCLPLEMEDDLSGNPNLKMDVTGKPRQDPVFLPSSILGGRPGAIPNARFQNVEDPVRRKLQTSLTAGATPMGQCQLDSMRGLIVLPERVDFGVLKEGNTYSFTVHLKNTGIDSCRFRITQPLPATGIRVLYKPGPIPAGLKMDLNIEIYAIAVGVTGESGIGTIQHDLCIITETDILSLPIKATVLTGHEFEHRSAKAPPGGKSPGTRLVSTNPPSSQGIIRPRRETSIGSLS